MGGIRWVTSDVARLLHRYGNGDREAFEEMGEEPRAYRRTTALASAWPPLVVRRAK
jgi:hypothetical protein